MALNVDQDSISHDHYLVPRLPPGLLIDAHLYTVDGHMYAVWGWDWIMALIKLITCDVTIIPAFCWSWD